MMKKIFIPAILFSALVVAGPALSEDKKVEDTKEGHFLSVEERRLHESLNKEKLRFEKYMQGKEEDINNKEAALNLLEKEVETKIKQMEKLKTEVAALFQNKNDELAKRAAELAKMYEKMDPEEAAPIITKLDQSLAISIFLKMKQKSAGQIMAAMDPIIASDLSTSYSTLIEKQKTTKGKR